jgi:hypothetical protein
MHLIQRVLLIAFALSSFKNVHGQQEVKVLELRNASAYKDLSGFCNDSGFVLIASVDHPSRPNHFDDQVRIGLVLRFKTTPKVGVTYDLVRDSSQLTYNHFSRSNWGNSTRNARCEGFVQILALDSGHVTAKLDIVVNSFPIKYTYTGRLNCGLYEGCGQ